MKNDWKVFYQADFWRHRGRDHAGRALPIEKRFDWCGEDWYVPAAYVCTQGVVLDLLLRVPQERFAAFAEKWSLTPERGCEEFSEEEVETIDRENPLSQDFSARLTLNGGAVSSERSCAVSYVPKLAEDKPALRLLAHYGFDMDCCWAIHRLFFPQKRREIQTLSLHLAAQPEWLTGPHFTAEAGKPVVLTHPATGAVYTLTPQRIEAETLELPPQGPEFPRHLVRMDYTLSPELPGDALRLRDTAPADPARRRDANGGIIGGADGPTAIFIGCHSEEERIHTAFSSPHFAPQKAPVEWRTSFRVMRKPDCTVALL